MPVYAAAARMRLGELAGDADGDRLIADAAAEMDIPLLGVIPSDATLVEFEFTGRPPIELGNDSPVYQAVAGMLEQALKLPTP